MRRFLPGIHTGMLKFLLPALLVAATVLLYLAGTFQSLQYELNDMQFRWRPDRKASNDIVIIAINPESEEVIGTSFERWQRARTGQAIANLAAAGAEIIALDFRYAKRPGEQEDDMALADAIADADNVILAVMVEGGQLLRTDEAILGDEEAGALGEGHLNVVEDEDGVLRRILLAKISNLEVPTVKEKFHFLYFDVEIAGQFEWVDDAVYDVDTDILTLVKKNEKGKTVAEYPVQHGNHPINYVGPAGSFKRIPFWKIYKNEFDREEVAGKICLVGDTRLRGGDFFVTPHSEYYQPTPESRPILQTMPGIEVHANGIQTILEGKTIRESTRSEGLIFVIVLGMGMGLLFFFFERGGLILPAIIVCVTQIAIIFMSYKLFASYDYQMASVPCLVVVALQFTSGVSYRWLGARRRIRQIQEMFGRYVSANIVKKMISGELSVNLEGHEKEITVSFLDIRNFTKTSEKLTPEQIGRLLNEFFSRMIGVIFSMDGTLDKLMGDCIMWFFNDPEEQPDHPQRAAGVALKMLEELRVFKTEIDLPGVEFMDIGIGVNSGTATVGNLGAPTFHDYTAIGDIVNLSSRLEGLNKEYGTQIIIGEPTYERVRGEYFCRELDMVRVKGKDLPVMIYELVARKDRVTEEQKQLASSFERHLKLYRNREFEKARAAFAALASQFPDDAPCRIYCERCEVLAQSPPEDSWSGVFTFTTK
jgi:adenylate cyclase